MSKFDEFKAHYVRPRGESRPLWNIFIDTRIQASEVHQDFNSSYLSAPNYSDVNNYDTRHSFKPEERGTVKKDDKPKQVTKVTNGYTPSGSERGRLVKIFHTLPVVKQHKDLLTTRNVIKSKDDVKRWEDNPYFYDVNGIDTQPPELISNRISTAHKYVEKRSGGAIPISFGAVRGHRNAIGGYSYSPFGKDLGNIILNPKKFDARYPKEKVLAHEIGHAYDRNVLGLPKGNLISGNVDFGRIKPLGKGINGLSFADENKLHIRLSEKSRANQERAWDYRRLYHEPFNKFFVSSRDLAYTRQNNEIFADSFSAIINNPQGFKKKNRSFFNIFRKSDRSLFKELKASDRASTLPFMSGGFK